MQSGRDSCQQPLHRRQVRGEAIPPDAVRGTRDVDHVRLRDVLLEGGRIGGAQHPATLGVGVDEQHREAIAEIEEEVQHMSALVNELLQFSRGGLEALNVKLTAVNVGATLSRVLDRESADGVDIRATVDSSLNVLAEPEYLFRALSNVVRNAIRYAGSAGPITISAAREKDGILIAVTDSGPGVPEESLEQVFEPFYRLDASRSRETGGMGLGLAIVKTCVEVCGGRVSCHNAKPSGLRVEIWLEEAKV